MKYYINTQSKLLGDEENTYFLDPDKFPEHLDTNFIVRYNVCVDTFRDNLHTLQYNDETKTVLEIDVDGLNFKSTLEDSPEVTKLVRILEEMVAFQKEHEAATLAWFKDE